MGGRLTYFHGQAGSSHCGKEYNQSRFHGCERDVFEGIVQESIFEAVAVVFETKEDGNLSILDCSNKIELFLNDGMQPVRQFFQWLLPIGSWRKLVEH